MSGPSQPVVPSNQCTKGHLRLFECAGLPEGKYIERRDCLLCEIERLQRERDIWLRGFVREAYPAGPPDLRSHFSDPETRQGITDRDIQAMQAVIDRLYKNRERSLSDEGTQPDETTAYRFPRAAAGSDWTIDTNFLLAVHQKVGIPEHFDHCDMEHIEEVLLALEKVSPRAPRSADPDAQPAGRAESTAEGSTQKASAPADGRRPDEAL